MPEQQQYEPRKYDVTDAHFERFRNECMRFIRLFGVNDWRVEFARRELDSRAECWTNLQGHEAGIVLAKTWTEHEPTPENLQRTAFHEVWELLTAELEIISSDYDMTIAMRNEAKERARHGLIRRLENCLLPLL